MTKRRLTVGPKAQLWAAVGYATYAPTASGPWTEIKSVTLFGCREEAEAFVHAKETHGNYSLVEAESGSLKGGLG